jgi:hypothetical protein
MYICGEWYFLYFKSAVGGPGWKGNAIPFHPGPPTADTEVKQVPFATYIPGVQLKSEPLTKP